MSPKARIRNGISAALYLAGITQPSRRASGRLSIVTFHRVLPEGLRTRYPYPTLAVSPEELRDALLFFTGHFDCGPLHIQHQRFTRAEPTERPLLAITFDDASHDNYEHGAPVLAALGLKASFFAPVNAVLSQECLWHDRLGFALQSIQERYGEERTAQLVSEVAMPTNGLPVSAGAIAEAAKGLSLEERLQFVARLEKEGAGDPPAFARPMAVSELRELHSAGHEIGSHSMSHCLMTECNDAQLEFEVRQSRLELERAIGEPIRSFCYPNGNADARAAKSVADAGYDRAVTTRWGSNEASDSAFLLRRFDMNLAPALDNDGRVSPHLLSLRMSGLHPGLAS